MNDIIIPPIQRPTVGAAVPSINQIQVPTLNNTAIILQTAGFGQIKTAIYKAGQPPVKTRDAGLEGGAYRSSLGTLVFSNLDISGGSYTDINGVRRDYPSIKLDTVLFKVGQQKHVIKTSIQGRNGTVKEYISDGDYSISVTGVINGSNGAYPEKEVNEFIKVLQVSTQLTVNSWYLRQLNITEMVIEYFELDQTLGSNSMQQFRIQAVSDLPVIITK
jgi:hypothetical protein